LNTERLRGPEYANMLAYVLPVVSRFIIHCVGSLSKQLQKHYLASDKSDYRIAKDSGVHRGTLKRLRDGLPISMRSFDALGNYFGLELQNKKRSGD